MDSAIGLNTYRSEPSCERIDIQRMSKAFEFFRKCTTGVLEKAVGVPVYKEPLY